MAPGEEELVPPEDLDDDENIYLRAWFARIKRYETSIPVRVERDGRWQSVMLSEATPLEWGNFMVSWLERGFTPVRMKSEQEIADTAARNNPDEED